ncbi:hypothetical protein Tco_1368943 [Tanacetum coccineum]
MSDKHVDMPVIDDEETLILEEASRSKMSEKAKDPEVNKNISHKPIDYEKLNRLTEDFGKCFTLQQELSAEQAFWLRMSDPTSKPSDALPVKIKAPKELPKISLVNESLKKLKFHIAKFNNVVKIRTTPNARTEGEWGVEHTKAMFNNEIIPFLKSLKDIFNVFDRDLLNEIMEELLLENDRLLQQIMSQDVLVTVMNSMLLIGETVNMDGNRKESCNLKAELLKSQNAFNDLLKRKEIVDIAAQIPSATTIVPGMFKLDLEPLAPSRAKSTKKHNKENIWKPTGHVFTEVGLKWKPTGKTFTIVGNSYPLTRITSANVVPPKKTTSNSAETQKPELKVYSRKPKNVKNVGCPDCSLVFGLQMFETYDRESLLAHELSGKCYYLKGMDLYGPMRVTSINRKRSEWRPARRELHAVEDDRKVDGKGGCRAGYFGEE